MPGCNGTGTAERSYPASEVSGGREETPRVRGQGRLGEATLHPRPGAVDLRSHSMPKARGSAQGQGRQLGRATHSRGQGLWPGGASRGAVAAQVLEGLEELSHVEGQELQW